jgi:hypothetical protein
MFADLTIRPAGVLAQGLKHLHAPGQRKGCDPQPREKKKAETGRGAGQ